MDRIKNIHWDNTHKILLIEMAGPDSGRDRSADIAGYHQALEADPDDQAVRYMLANDLCIIGQREEATAQWEQVAASADGMWSETARKALALFGHKPDEPAA